MSDPKMPSDGQIAAGLAEAGRQMQQERSSETEAALDRSLAVQGEDASEEAGGQGEEVVPGADEEE